jgi:hypothetical protein
MIGNSIAFRNRPWQNGGHPSAMPGCAKAPHGQNAEGQPRLETKLAPNPMENHSTWETILIGLLAILVVFWFSPGIKAAMERGKQAEANWGAALIPLGIVTLFVFFLILAS